MPLFNPVLAGLPAGGTTGQVLAKQSAADYDTGWSTPSSGGGLPLQLAIQDGRYYSALTTSVTGTFLLDDYAGQLTAAPFQVNEEKTWTEISIEVTTGGAGDVCHVGIYADSNGLPGALIVDSGEIDCSSTGTKAVTISVTLAVGNYWLAILPDTSAATAKIVGTGVGNLACQHIGAIMMGVTNMTGSMSSPVAVSKFPQTYGALPDPFGTPTGREREAPFIGLRTGV